ncbi:MAG: DUF1028 domain-containing protein [Alphaproteobacteria bacterium]|nr:MAG: DUF1028 domain-containing protein [Alphaproteobacteria bacterium]
MALLTILARCRRTGQLGLASYADRRAIAARHGRIRPGVGVAAVQGAFNPRHEKWALDLLALGVTPREALISSCLKDKYPEHRQILLLSANGEADVYEGSKRPKCAGKALGPNYVLGGTGLPILEPVLAAHDFLEDRSHLDVSLASRLMGALEAAKIDGLPIHGEAQSACLQVLGGDGQMLFDLRVDAGSTPILELRDLLDRAMQWQEQVTPEASGELQESKRDRAA